jgi:cytochrome c-type biogenesis protein
VTHLLRNSPVIGLIVAFGAGALSFLSPCVLPLVPGYLSLMSGVKASELSVATRAEQRTLLRSTLLFVAGFTAVFVALGASASTVGTALHTHQIGLNRVAGGMVILMGLFLAGLVAPRMLQQERRFHVSPAALGSWAPPVMGMAFAFGWTPCIGPTLAVVYSLATAQGTLGRGVLLLLFYSLGLGVPFVAAGLAFGRLTGVFGWVKANFRAINLVSGLLLAAFGILMVTNRVSVLSHGVTDVLDWLGLKRLTTS